MSQLGDHWRASIVEKCASTVHNGPCTILFDDYAVKVGSMDRFFEGDTQAFVYAQAQNSPDSDAPRVPRVYDCFARPPIYYLVKERVALPTVEEWIQAAASEAEAQDRHEEACRPVAKAIAWLSVLPAPDGADVGLISGAYVQTLPDKYRAQSGFAMNQAFGCDGAPYRYTNAAALQEHIKQALARRPPRAPPRTLDIAGERLVMVLGWMAAKNFLIDPATRQVTLNNFSCVSALPQSFVNSTLRGSNNSFAEDVAKLLPWGRTDNSLAIGAASVIYTMSSGQFGLDKDGRPEPRKKLQHW